MDNNIGSKILAFIVTIFISIIATVAIDGYIVSKLWTWFVVPLFNLPSLSMTQAYGLCMVFRALKGMNLYPDKTKNQEFGEVVVTGIIALIFKLFILMPIILITGKIVKSFI